MAKDNDTAKAHPVKHGDLTFKYFFRYLATLKKHVPKRLLSNGGETGTVLIHPGAPSYASACSDLNHRYPESRLDKETMSKDQWSRPLV